MSIYDSPELQQVKSEAGQAASAYSSAATAGLTLPDMLREALTKKFSTSNPLLQQREGAVKTYMTESAAAPLAVTPKSAGGQADVVYTPLEQASLIAGRRASALAPLTSLNAILGLTQSGMENIIGQTGTAYQAQVQALQNEAQLKRQAYTDLLSELSAKAEEAYKYAALAQSGSGTATGRTTNILNKVANDAASGKTLKEIMQTYGTDANVTPDEILRVYNTNSMYGPAKETSEELNKLYGTKYTQSAAALAREELKRQTGLDVIGEIESVDKSIKDKTGSTSALSVLSKLNAPLGLGKMFISKGNETNLADLESKYFLLTQTILTKIQGSRPSDYDVKSYQDKAGPSIQLTPEVNEMRIKNLLNLLGGGSSSSNSDLDNLYNSIYGR
jgi:hypothetical protein